MKQKTMVLATGVLLVIGGALAATADSGNTTNYAQEPDSRTGQSPQQLSKGDTIADTFQVKHQQPGEAKQIEDAARAKLAPDALRVQTSLMSAADQLKALRMQYKTTENVPISKATVAPLRSFGKEVNSDLSRAIVYQDELQAKAGPYKGVVDSQSFKMLKESVEDAKKLSSDFQAKASTQAYWNDRGQANSDLNTLEKHVNDALDKAKAFGLTELDAAIG